MTASEILGKIKSVKSKDENSLLLDKTKGTLTGTLIGGGLGLLLAYNRKWSLLMGAVIGGIIGGVTTKFLVNRN